MRKLLSLALAAALLPTLAQAGMTTRTLSYDVEGTMVESVLVFDDAVATKRPALVMVPNWMGVNAAQVEKAKAIAGQDYVILVADVYGKVTRPTNADEAGKAAGAMYADRAALRARVNAALDQLASAKDAPVDAAKLGAIGFCCGGGSVGELTFQVKLFDTGAVEYHYCALTPGVPRAAGASAAIGMQNSSATRGVTFALRRAGAADTASAIRFTPAP